MFFFPSQSNNSQRSQGVAGRNVLTVDDPLPLRLQKCRYAFEVFILLLFSSGCEPTTSGSQVHETRFTRWGRYASFSFSISIVYFQRRHTSTSLWGLSHQRQAKVHEKKNSSKIHTPVERRGKIFYDGPSKSTSLRTREDDVCSVTPTEHGERTLSWRRFRALKNWRQTLLPFS